MPAANSGCATRPTRRGCGARDDGSINVRATWRQPNMADTLEHLAAQGHSRLLRGELAEHIAAEIETQRRLRHPRRPGRLRRAGQPDPITGTFRGLTVNSAAPPASGISACRCCKSWTASRASCPVNRVVRAAGGRHARGVRRARSRRGRPRFCRRAHRRADLARLGGRRRRRASRSAYQAPVASSSRRRRHHPRLDLRRRRQCRRADAHARHLLGRDRAGHRHRPEQRHGPVRSHPRRPELDRTW